MTVANSIELRVGGMTCSHCPPAVEKALLNVAGVVAAQVNAATNVARIEYDAARAKIDDILNAVRSIGYVPGTATTRMQIKNMHCSSRVVRIELALRQTPGVVAARASLGPNAVGIEYQPEKVDFEAIGKTTVLVPRNTYNCIAGRHPKRFGGGAAGTAAVLNPGTELCYADDVVRLVEHVKPVRV